MPHYDYHCTSCGHAEEILQKMSDQPLGQCPSCQQEAFQRKLGNGTGLHFKGSGFYITDYAPEAPKENTKCCPCGKNSACE
ncbi:MAG: zinc ribbon domain-containing protein [Parachlamydia sp.]|jgi:putative FmdB family regulatory protein|nr:zinc ribbon domain-containing protein [Parachlamydia sp.]